MTWKICRAHDDDIVGGIVCWGRCTMWQYVDGVVGLSVVGARARLRAGRLLLGLYKTICERPRTSSLVSCCCALKQLK